MEEQAAQQQKPELQAPPTKKSGMGKKVLGIVLALVTVVALAAAGWKWHGQISEYQMKQNDANQQISQLQKQIEKIKADQKALDDLAEKAAAEPLSGTLAITEWGVYIKSTKSPMSYKITKDKDGTQTAWLTNKESQSLSKYAADSNCNKDNEDGTPNHWYQAVIIRSNKKLTDNFNKNAEVAIIDNYYYYTQSGNGTCTEGSHSYLEAKTHEELSNAASHIFKTEN